MTARKHISGENGLEHLRELWKTLWVAKKGMCTSLKPLGLRQGSGGSEQIHQKGDVLTQDLSPFRGCSHENLPLMASCLDSSLQPLRAGFAKYVGVSFFLKHTISVKSIEEKVFNVCND